jgi:Fe-S-cluster containining protein
MHRRGRLELRRLAGVSDGGGAAVVRPAGCVAGCSACCHDRTGTGRWVELGQADAGVPAELTWSSPAGRYMRTRTDGSCVALVEGLCSIYAARPEVCRDFQAGSWQCDSARARHGQG